MYDREFRTSAPSAAWSQSLSSLITGRVYCDTFGLPDATFLTLHGTTEDYKQTAQPAIAASRPERIVPLAGQPWQEMAPEAHVRGYHSGGLLINDGRAISMGGQFDLPPPASPVTGFRFQSDAQVLSPAYMFQGPRPRISSWNIQVPYGATFTLDVTLPISDSLGSVVLISPGSVTHGIDFEQRFVPLTIQSASAPTILPSGWKSVTYTIQGPAQDPGTVPPESHLAPPGYYLLFVVTAPTAIAPRGVPSQAPFVRVQ